MNQYFFIKFRGGFEPEKHPPLEYDWRGEWIFWKVYDFTILGGQFFYELLRHPPQIHRWIPHASYISCTSAGTVDWNRFDFTGSV